MDRLYLTPQSRDPQRDGLDVFAPLSPLGRGAGGEGIPTGSMGQKHLLSLDYLADNFIISPLNLGIPKFMN